MSNREYEVVYKDTAKAPRVCQMCTDTIEKKEVCIRTPFGSMHEVCYVLRCIELIGIEKIEELYDTEFEDYLEERIAKKI